MFTIGSNIQNNNTLSNNITKNDPILNDLISKVDSSTLKSYEKAQTTNILNNLFNSNSSSTLNSNIKDSLTTLSNNLSSSNDPSLKDLKTAIDNFLNTNKDLSNTNSQNLNQSLKSLLSNINSSFQNNISQNTQVNSLNNLLSQLTTLSQNLSNSINPAISDAKSLIDNILSMFKGVDLNQLSQNLTQNTPSNQQNLLNSNTLNTLLNDLKTILSSNTQNQTYASNIKIIDNILNQMTNNNLLKNLSNMSTNNLQNFISSSTQVSQNSNLTQNIPTSLQNIGNLLSSLWSSLIDGSSTANSVNNTLTNSSLFKSFDNMNSLLNNLSNTFSTLANNEPKLETIKTSLDNFIQNFSKFDATNIKSFVENSGVFLESKLAMPNTASNIANDDLKAILNQAKEIIQNNPNITKEEPLKNIDRVLNQIDYYQMLSVTSASNWVYVPVMWDELNDGSMKLKSKQNNNSYCEIDLDLRDFNRVKVQLFLYNEESLNIAFKVENPEFKEIMQDNLPKLRSFIYKLGLESTISIRDFELENKISSKYKNFDDDIGVEIKA